MPHQNYSWVTDEMFNKKLEEILDREEHLFSIPGVYKAVSENSASYNEAMDRAESLDLDFETALEEVAQSYNAKQLLAIPGLYEEVSEYFNNDVLKELKYEHDYEYGEEYDNNNDEDDDLNRYEAKSGSTHLKLPHRRYQKISTFTKETRKMRKHGVPELGPDYFIPVDDEELDSEVVSWLHYGQDDPIYALGSRLIAYGETEASPEELETLETILEKMLMRVDLEGVPEGEEDDFDRMADLLESVRSILSQYKQEIEAHQERIDDEYDKELEQKERWEQESRSRPMRYSSNRTKTAAVSNSQIFNYDEWEDDYPILIIFKEKGSGEYDDWEVVDGATNMEEAEELLTEYQTAFGPSLQVRIHDESYRRGGRGNNRRGFDRPPGIYGSTLRQRRSSFIQYRKAQMGADIALLQKSMQSLSKTQDKKEAISFLRDISDAALGIISELGEEEAKTASVSSRWRKRRQRRGSSRSSLQADYLTLKNGINALQKATEKEDLILALQDVADSARDLLSAIG